MDTTRRASHVAGIIPVDGAKLNFGMPWHECLNPVAENYHAIEKTIMSAASAGCNTIWLVTYGGTQKIIKKRIGSWVYDPKSVWDPMLPFMHKKEIPVYYISINPKDRNRRDSYCWSILYGIRVADYVSRAVSKWVTPSNYLVLSPYSVVSDEYCEQIRPLLKQNKNLLPTYNGKTFFDDMFIPFSITHDNSKICRKWARQNYDLFTTDTRDVELFSQLDLTAYDKNDLTQYYNISTWEGYQNFLSSDYSKSLSKPKYMVTHKWRGLIKA
jgi:hypothetical protein